MSDKSELIFLETASTFAHFRSLLPKKDQEVFDSLFTGVKERYAWAISTVEHAVPIEAVLFAMVIDQAREIERLKMVVGLEKGW